MKTRVVYPSIWDNDIFSSLSKDSRLACNFLINNEKLGLTRYSQISDKYATYCTGLTNPEWTKAKEELEDKKLFFFYDGWVYHNHDFAYVDYFGRDRVIKGKETEEKKIPSEIKEYFKGLITSYEEVVKTPINPKSKIINKEEIIKRGKHPYRDGEITDEMCVEVAKEYGVSLVEVKKKREEVKLHCGSTGKTYADYKLTMMNWIRRDIDEGKIKSSTAQSLKPITKKELEVLALARDKQAQINYFKQQGYDTSNL